MEMANITYQDNDGNIKVEIDEEWCIACGRCVSACKHDVRYYIYDSYAVPRPPTSEKQKTVTPPELSDSDIEQAFEMLGKTEDAKQNINCGACGSDTCYNMARKVALKVNIPINCMAKAMEDARTEHEHYLEAHDQYLEAVETAREASRAKSAFLANMSHEIMTPMNAILGMLELLEHEELDARQMGYVNDVSLSAKSLLGIINDILDMSRIESGELEFQPVDYSLTELINNLAAVFMTPAQEKGIEFTIETDGHLPECLYGDDLKLKQVLTNTLANAVRFTEKGNIKFTTITDGEKLIFKVEDTGIGIREEEIPELFNEYEQGDSFKNRGVVGTGLGLSITKSFVDMMGGDIAVESEFGNGTTFTITIPIVAGNPDNIRTDRIAGDEQTLSAPEAKVLVTDDNEFNLKVAVGLLGLMDIKAETAASGAEAIKLVQQNDYDIIFMDHMMPDMDGIETLREIRKLGGKYQELLIVALTANSVQSAREMYFSNGFNDFLAKPIDSNELRDILKRRLPPEKVGTKVKYRLKQDELSEEEELLRKAAITFVKENQGAIENLTASLEAGDIKTAHRIAHTIKSSAGYLGKKNLQDAALSLEQSLQSEAARYTPEQLETFKNELGETLRELEPILIKAQSEKTDTEQISDETLTSLLEKLRPLLEKGDFGAVGFVERLKGVEGMEKLAELIDDYDFEGALQLL